MRQFQIAGLKRTSSEYLKAELATNEPMVIPISVKNPSADIDITNLRLRKISVPEDVTLEFEPVDRVAAGETVTLNVTITGTVPSEGSNWIPCVFVLDNDEDCPLSLTIYEYTRNRLGALAVSEKSIRTTMNIHSSRTYPITITNVGRGNTGKISVLLPSWIKSETPTTLPSLAQDESTTIILRLVPDGSMTANIPVIGQLAINCENANGVTIPFNITPVSELTGNLRVNVCDEYTYYTAEKPMVKDARVQLRNGYTNTLIDEYNTGEVGFVLFSDIPEGYYTINISAPNHDSFRQNVIVSPGETTLIEALISFQAISVEWEVEETEVEDEYEVVTTVRFVTNVPKPVLVLEVPKKFDLFEYADNSRNLFYVGVTNQGLISATKTMVTIPSGEYSATDEDGNRRTAHFEWQNGVQEFTLAPKQTRFFPVYLVVGNPDDDDVPAEAPSRAAARSGGCSAGYSVAGFYPCGGSDQSTSSSASSSIGTCGGGGGGFGIAIDGGGGGLGGPGGSSIVSGSASSSTSSGSVSMSGCNSCGMELANAMASCAIGFTKMGCVYGIVSTGADIAENGFDPTDWKTWTNIALTVGGCIFQNSAIGNLFSAASCAWAIANACEGGSEAPLRRSLGQDEDGISEDDDTVNGANYASVGTIHAGVYIAPELQILIDAAMLANNYYVHLDKFYSVLFGTTSGGWAEMTFADCCSLSAVLSNAVSGEELDFEEWVGAKPNKLSTEEFRLFIERLNNTTRRRNGLDYDNHNFINDETLTHYTFEMKQDLKELQNRGYSDVDEYFDYALNQWEKYKAGQSNSVCASVVIQFEQKLVMTRQAFRGTLTVTNGHTSEPMRDVRLSLEVKDEAGNVATSHEFQINPESLSGFEGELALDAGWSLAANSKGVVTIVFIPTRYAAPETDVAYSFGGTLVYTDPFTGAEVTRTLSPVTLTVRPSPILSLDYFMERTLYGDNPLTKDVIEPIVPGEFSLIINNTGYGDATKVRMTTKQPKIIENEKGLYIDFEIVGTTLNGKDSSLALGESVVSDFGTIPAGTTAYAQWWLTSTLLGNFGEYDVSYTHVTSYDNPDLTLIDEVNIHQLIHSVQLDDSKDRPELGFLVTDNSLAELVPDHIYMTTGEVETVGVILAQSLTKISELEYRLTVEPKFSGWVYGEIADPTGGKQTVERVVRVRDSKEIPVRNFWQTEFTVVNGDPINEYILHYADDMVIPTEEYIITFSPKPDVELEVESFDNVPGNKEINYTPTEYIDVTFNKAIDPETFTGEDLTFTVEGVKQDAGLVSIAPIAPGDSTCFRLTFDPSLIAKSGFYSLTVQTAEITDNEGFNGSAGKECHWVYLATQKFAVNFVAPDGYTFDVQAYAPKVVDADYQYYTPVLSPENMVYDTTPVAVKDSYRPVELLYPLHLTFDLIPDNEQVAALHKNQKVQYYLARMSLNGTLTSEAISPVTNKLMIAAGDEPSTYYLLESSVEDLYYVALWVDDYSNCVRITTDTSDVPATMSDYFTLNTPAMGQYLSGSDIDISASVDDGFSVKWYRVLSTRTNASAELGFEPDELEYITDALSFKYRVNGKSFNDLLDKVAADPGYCMTAGEYNWIVCKVFCHIAQEERVFRKGWNYVSFNDENLDLNAFMSTCGGAVAGIRGDSGIYMFDSNTGWTGTPIELSVGKSYDIYFSRECTYTRLNVVRPQVEKTPITLTTGWTRIGYTPTEELSVGEALKEYTPTQNDVIKDYDGFAIYDDGVWKGTMTRMTSGVGYKYFTESPDSFTYNAEGMGGATGPRRVVNYADPQPAKGEYPDNMTVIAKVFTHEAEVIDSSYGYKVLAFVDDECRGVGEYVDADHVFITIYGTEAAAPLAAMRRAPATPENVRYEVVTDEFEIYRIAATTDFTLAPQGTLSSPVLLNMPEESITGVSDARTDVRMYSARPNTVHDILYLIGLTDRIHAWSLHDMSGAVVATGNRYDDAEGIDVSRCPGGHYILMLDTDFGPQSVKVIKN